LQKYKFKNITYVSSSTKLKKSAEQVLPGSEVGEGRGKGWRSRGKKWPK
jgi:hypothetical protein